ncbi:MAG: valine--tRNA ligase, partial [Patescibacteria group bacterium]
MSDDQILIPKAYEAKDVEDKIYKSWEKSGYFNPDNLPNLADRQEVFSIALPPPNVTGTLHMGHAAMLAIEDAMTRFARMSGKRALWLPGTDHAAIATQTKVEKLLIKEGIKDPRHELGRDKFLERVEKFAQESHDTIVNQMKKIGTSVDWSREAYTLDEPRNRAVNAAFKKMYDDGLIYQGFKVVNWCPRCKSTLADDEVEYKEGTAKLYTFKYDQNFPISISTTRPETKLGDTAVAVNPKDKRYKKFVGQEFSVEFAGGPLKIKIIADEGVDPDYGTGALGVTPAHSKIDEEIAKNNGLPYIDVIDEQGKMNDQSGMSGLTTLEAREKVVAWLRENNLLAGEEEASQNLSICYRCSTAIEPLPKKQWFIDVNKEFIFHQSKRAPISKLKDGQKATLKSLMQHVVKNGDIKILPNRFDKTYFHWIDNLRDWNISRQIWFGHRIPVWYKDDKIKIGDVPEGVGWEQDPDTLDTWFSSGLWTFSTLGWPDENASDFQLYHPTSVMETGYDILFFWVARMILMSTYLLGEVPFRTVYLHGLIRDEEGHKMSKSLDNIIDPLDMINSFGADATRLSLLVGATPGSDMKLSEDKIAGYRNFTNKLWNIARFVLLNVEDIKNVEAVEAVTLADK